MTKERATEGEEGDFGNPFNNFDRLSVGSDCVFEKGKVKTVLKKPPPAMAQNVAGHDRLLGDLAATLLKLLSIRLTSP